MIKQDYYQNERTTLVLPFEKPERWAIIEEVFKSQISTPEQLDRAIEKTAGFAANSCNFFQRYFGRTPEQTEVSPTTKDRFIGEVVPFMQQLGLKMPILFKDGLPLLLPQKEQTVTLTREQVACLLVHGLFCTFGGYQHILVRGVKFPSFDFTSFLKGSFKPQMECMMHYFDRICTSPPKGNLIIHRKVLPDTDPAWASSTKLLPKIVVSADGTIEDSPAQYHADFANEYIGGGALTGGNVQEEILFVIKPECLVTMLFCARMDNRETIIITGPERFSAYTGYGMSFCWAGPFQDTTAWDDQHNCLKKSIIAMDAIVSMFSGGQFDTKPFKRDLNKAYCGFSYHLGEKGGVATGNWGCGAFGGNLYLKAFQQILAAAEAETDLYYYTFKKVELANTIQKFVDLATTKKLSVRDLFTEYIAGIDTKELRENVLVYLMNRFK